jgi:alpha-tubulin suppressor-like RCC1 family protein
VPVKVPLPVAVNQVSQGGSGPNNGQTVALLRGGTTWAWGDNRNGQLGTSPGTRLTTLPVAPGIHLTQVSSTAQNVAGVEAHG